MPTYLNGKPLTFGDWGQIRRLNELDKIKDLLQGSSKILNKLKRKINYIQDARVQLAYLRINNIDINDMANIPDTYEDIAHQYRILVDAVEQFEL